MHYATQSITQAIGMEAYKSPSVFNFYQHDYSPSGALADAGLYSPEALLATPPNLIGLLNGLTSLARDGLSSCSQGFGRACADKRLQESDTSVDWSDGRLSFTPTDAGSAAAVVSELDLLLTAGRLNPGTTAVITQAYQRTSCTFPIPLTNTTYHLPLTAYYLLLLYLLLATDCRLIKTS